MLSTGFVFLAGMANRHSESRIFFNFFFGGRLAPGCRHEGFDSKRIRESDPEFGRPRGVPQDLSGPKIGPLGLALATIPFIKSGHRKGHGGDIANRPRRRDFVADFIARADRLSPFDA